MTTASAINARDFNRNATDKDRDEWTSGQLRHLVAALAGSQVIVVADRSTGFTLVNAVLIGVETRSSDASRLIIRQILADRSTLDTAYSIRKIGTIIDLGDTNARWVAIRSYSEENTRASVKAQYALCERLGIEDRIDLPRGTWDVSSLAHGVHVSFQPERHDRTGRVKFTWWNYSVRELAEYTRLA